MRSIPLFIGAAAGVAACSPTYEVEGSVSHSRGVGMPLAVVGLSRSQYLGQGVPSTEALRAGDVWLVQPAAFDLSQLQRNVVGYCDGIHYVFAWLDVNGSSALVPNQNPGYIQYSLPAITPNAGDLMGSGPVSCIQDSISFYLELEEFTP